MKPMEYRSRALLISACALLAACEVTVDQNTADFAENQAAALTNQAEQLADQARDEASSAANIVEQQAGALQDRLNERDRPAENEAEPVNAQ